MSSINIVNRYIDDLICVILHNHYMSFRLMKRVIRKLHLTMISHTSLSKLF